MLKQKQSCVRSLVQCVYLKPVTHDIPCSLFFITPLRMMNVGIYISVDNMHTHIYTLKPVLSGHSNIRKNKGLNSNS